MHTHLLNNFRNQLRRSLKEAGYSHIEAMELVEAAQRMAPHPSIIPNSFFNIPATVRYVATRNAVDETVAKLIIVNRPAYLFEASHTQTHYELRRQ